MLKSCIENYVVFVYQLSPSSCILWIISRLFRIPVCVCVCVCACVCVLVAQLCLTLCDPMDCGLPGSSVHGILQARMLEPVAVFFSREGIFLTQESNLNLLHCKQILYCLNRQGSPAAAAAKSLQPCPTLCDPIDCSLTRLLRPWDFPGKSTGVGCHCLLIQSKCFENSCLSMANSSFAFWSFLDFLKNIFFIHDWSNSYMWLPHIQRVNCVWSEQI